MALSVPLSRFTSRVGGGSAFFVRPHSFLEPLDIHQTLIIFGSAILLAVLATLYAVYCQTPRSRRLFVAAFVSVLVILLDYSWGKGLVAQFDTRHYARTVGEVIHKQLITHTRMGGRIWYDLDISYRYMANGQTYVGDRVRLLEHSGWFSGQSMVKWGHSVGSQIPVFYDPQNPQVAYLSVGLNQADDSITLLVLAAANVLFFYLWFCVFHKGNKEL